MIANAVNRSDLLQVAPIEPHHGGSQRSSVFGATAGFRRNSSAMRCGQTGRDNRDRIVGKSHIRSLLVAGEIATIAGGGAASTRAPEGAGA